MASAGAGFFGGLTKSFGGALLERQAEQAKKQAEGNKQLFGLLTHAIDSGDLDPAVGYPLVAQFISAAFGGGEKSKGGKGGGKGPFAFLSDPEALGGVLTGLHKATSGSADKGSMGPTGLSSAGPQPDSSTAQPPIEPSGVKPASNVPATPTSIFRSRAQRQAEEEGAFKRVETFKTDEAIREAEATGRYKPRGGSKFLPGTTSGKDLEGKLDFDDNPVDPAKHYKIERHPDGTETLLPVEVKKEKEPTVRNKLTGEALQAYDMNQMLAGLDPNTGKKPDDPEEAKRLVAAGQEMKRARNLKNQTAIVRIETGKTSQDDIKELAPQVANGTLVPSQLGSMGGAQRIKVMAEANRERRANGLPPLNYRQMQLDFYGAQRAISSLNGPQMIRFQGLGISVVNTIDEVNALADELKQGSVQKFNSAKRNTILQVFGNTPQSETAARYISAVNTLKEEFASLAQGGYAPTEAAWKLANQQINEDYGLKDLQASLNEAQRLINFRLKAFDQIQPRGFGGQSDAPQPPPSGDQNPFRKKK